MNAVLKTYKTQVASRYIPLAPEDLGRRMLESEGYHVSRKLDGHLYFLCADGDGVWLENHGGNVIEELPLLEEAKKALKGTSCILAGELYTVDDKERTYGFSVPSALEDAPDTLRFGGFDVVQLDGKPFSAPWKEVFAKVESLLGTDGMVHAIAQTRMESRADVAKRLEEEMAAGSEGIVVRLEDGPTYKVKPYVDLDLVVLGYCEDDGDREGMLREFLVGLARPEGQFQMLGKVGNGFSDAERKKWLKAVQGSEVESNYLEVSGSNVAFTMVKPELVIQVRCLDLLAETARGPIRRPVLTWTGKVFEHTGEGGAVSMIGAAFEGGRSDKKASPEDAGMAQVERWMAVAGSEAAEPLAESELLRREVYVKERKGIQSVRKFVAWKTNKEGTGEWPAFVLHVTDYSPTRKEPLKKSVSVAPDQAGLDALFAAELEDNIKKGWEKV